MGVQFPLGLAIGPNFCNRDKERAALKANIDQVNHTWLTAPRRFGKTSLITQTLHELDRQKDAPVHRTIDILTIRDAEDVESILEQAISEIVRIIVPGRQQSLQDCLDFFKKLRPEIVISKDGPSLRFSAQSDVSRPDSITTMLQGLDKLAGHYQKHLVIIFDEFQRLAEIDDTMSLEASVRHAVERAKHITFLFSGSHRSMLKQMFENKKRPLFHLCARMELDRISAQDYRDFLEKRAKLTWSKSLSDASFETIVQLAQRHPYYMNKLCGIIWQSKSVPTPSIIQGAWRKILDEERSIVSTQLSQLSRNQQRVFLMLASNPTDAPTGAEFVSQLNLAVSSIRQAINVLLDEDYIYQDHAGFYRVLNPAAQSLLAKSPGHEY